MTKRSDGRLLELAVSVDAEPSRVYRMFTEPDELKRWWGPRGFSTPDATLDVRVGGRYRFSMRPPDGEVFHLSGEFLEIEPEHRLVFTFRWEEPHPDDRTTTATVSFVRIGEATEVSLSQGEFATDERLELHRGGWTDSLEKLREAVERG
jgi:uncharacterized protein YndB with AHSA1/START domain